MVERFDAVVIGGGQAGMVASRALTARGVDHVVLEQARVAERWRSARWDSLRFQFPNSVLGLPGMPYDGDDPEGFAHHTEVLQRLERYAAATRVPLREQTRVTSLVRHGPSWTATTEDGEVRARAVVLATGPFQRPRLPALARDLPADVHQVHAQDYRSPDELPDGGVLVVGSGASGAQIAEELLGAGRATYLCVSRHRWVPRRFLGQDVFHWLIRLGVMDRTRADWVDGRMPPTVLVTGIGGGHDLDVRGLGDQGATLLGSLLGIAGDEVMVAEDAGAILDAADGLHDETVRAIRNLAANQGLDLPAEQPSAPRARPRAVPTLSLRGAGITSVVWATGYSFDYDWVRPACTGAAGEPVQRRGVSPMEGLYFLGLHWMHTFKSGTFLGVGDDAEHVADHLVRTALPARTGS